MCICIYLLSLTRASLRGGRVLLAEMLLPRIARQGAVCLVSIRGQALKARIEKFELDEGFQACHPSFRILVNETAPLSPCAAHSGSVQHHLRVSVADKWGQR